MKTGPGRFQSSEIDERIVLQATLSLLGVQFGDFGTFPAPRRGETRFFACPANESAKGFAGDIEARVREPLPDLFVGLSGAQRGFNFTQKRTDEGGLRSGWFCGKFLQGLAVEINR